MGEITDAVTAEITTNVPLMWGLAAALVVVVVVSALVLWSMRRTRGAIR